jgi:hypothetical protein
MRINPLRDLMTNPARIKISEGDVGFPINMVQRASNYRKQLIDVESGSRAQLAVNTYERGLATRLVPFYDVCLDGSDFRDPTYELDTPAELVSVDTLIKAFDEQVRKSQHVNLAALNPDLNYGAMIYIMTRAFIERKIAGGRLGCQKNSRARFNYWHCFVYEIFTMFSGELLVWQEPFLELHFLIARQRRKSRGRANVESIRAANNLQAVAEQTERFRQMHARDADRTRSSASRSPLGQSAPKRHKSS